MLLWPEDRARSGNPDPADEVCSWELEVFHGVASYQGASTAQASLAVNSKDARVTLTQLEELVHDELRWCRTIDEEQVCVVDPILCELGSVVVGFVEADNMCHAKVSKHLEVILWGVPSSVWSILINWAHEGDELLGEDPIQVTILNFLIVLVLFVVEFPKVIPA